MFRCNNGRHPYTDLDFAIISQIFLVGTKYDLKDVEAHTKHISKDEGERMAKKIKAVGYFETSSKPPPHGISELFEAIKKSANDPPKPPQPFCSLL